MIPIKYTAALTCQDGEIAAKRLLLLSFLPCTCDWCGHEFISVNDLIARDVIQSNEAGQVRCGVCYRTPARMVWEGKEGGANPWDKTNG